MAAALKRRDRPGAGKERENVYSGRLLLRMPPSLHADLARLAEERGTSLNGLITTALTDAVRGDTGDVDARTPASPRLTRIALVVNLVVVALAGALALGLLLVALGDAL